MDEFFAVLATLTALSLMVTKGVDFLRNMLDEGDSYPKYVWNAAAFGVGIAYCVGWQVDVSASVIALVPALAEQSSRLEGVAGQVLTGLIIGGFAGFFHELLDALHGVARRGQPA